MASRLTQPAPSVRAGEDLPGAGRLHLAPSDRQADRGRRAETGLRRQWRTWFAILIAVLIAALSGVFISYSQVVGHYRASADQLNRAITLTSQLTQQITTHEALAHSLWNGAPVDLKLYLRQQDSISALLQRGGRELTGADQRQLLDHTSQVWQAMYVSRGLWGPTAHPGTGVTLARQQEFGSAGDLVTVTVSTLTKVSLADGTRDLAATHTLQGVLIGLLVGLFALIFAVTGYFARRVTIDVLQPVESLHRGVTKLSEGNLDYRVRLPGHGRPNELSELAAAFNAMAAELDKSHQDLSHQARHDRLTGLVNRAAAETELAARFRPDDQRRHHGLSVLFIDIDDFKLVNDSLGHAVGDALLVGVAARLTRCVRVGDVVARLGGDEFAVLAIDTEAGPAHAVSVAERALGALAAPFVIGDHEVVVSASIGIAVRTPETTGPEDLVAQADFAMYAAKAQGKGRLQVFDAAMRDAVTGGGTDFEARPALPVETGAGPPER